jgi:hypothetical protein
MHSFETLGATHPVMQRHILEDWHPWLFYVAYCVYGGAFMHAHVRAHTHTHTHTHIHVWIHTCMALSTVDVAQDVPALFSHINFVYFLIPLLCP